MTWIDLREASAAVRAEVLALNRAVEAQTSALDEGALAALVGAALSARAIALPDGRLAGFLIGFGPGADYASPNYRWLAGRLPRLAYIDRVVVAPAARGRGIARALYEAFAATARTEGLDTLACEVNLVPPNPASDAFHAALGFVEVGRGEPAPGKVVRYLARPIDQAGPGAR